MAKSSLNTAVKTAGNNWKWIGAIAATCGTAAFLLGTDSGRQIRSNVQDRLNDLYDRAHDEVSSGYSSIRERMRGMTSGETASENSNLDSKVQQLQDKFRLVV